MNEVTIIRIKKTSIKIPARHASNQIPNIHSCEEMESLGQIWNGWDRTTTVEGVQLMTPYTSEHIVELNVDCAAATVGERREKSGRSEHDQHETR